MKVKSIRQSTSMQADKGSEAFRIRHQTMDLSVLCRQIVFLSKTMRIDHQLDFVKFLRTHNCRRNSIHSHTEVRPVFFFTSNHIINCSRVRLILPVNCSIYFHQCCLLPVHGLIIVEYDDLGKRVFPLNTTTNELLNWMINAKPNGRDIEEFDAKTSFIIKANLRCVWFICNLVLSARRQRRTESICVDDRLFLFLLCLSVEQRSKHERKTSFTQLIK